MNVKIVIIFNGGTKAIIKRESITACLNSANNCVRGRTHVVRKLVCRINNKPKKIAFNLDKKIDFAI